MNKIFEYTSDEGLFLSIQYFAISKTLMEVFQNQKETLIELTPLDRTYDEDLKHSPELKVIDIEIDRECEAETTIEIDVGISDEIGYLNTETMKSDF